MSGVCRRRKDIKGKTGDPGSWIQSLCIPETPRGPSPRALQLGKALCSVLASDPEALGSSGLLTLGQSFLARPLPPSGAPLSALGWWLLPSQEAGGEEEGNQPPVRVGGQEGLTVSPRQCPQ